MNLDEYLHHANIETIQSFRLVAPEKEIRSVTMHRVDDEGPEGLGVYALADIVVAGTCQQVRSGGLYGIESDSDDEYLAEVETEELGELTLILKELGFSQEAIEEAYADLSDAE